jgi:hypothetical protein
MQNTFLPWWKLSGGFAVAVTTTQVDNNSG